MSCLIILHPFKYIDPFGLSLRVFVSHNRFKENGSMNLREFETKIYIVCFKKFEGENKNI